jgi:PAS domain S-box-containing protein
MALRIVELSPDAIVVVDATGRIQLINQQTEALFGYAREALLGQPVETLLPARFQAQHPQHRARYTAHPHTRPMGTGLGLFGRRHDGTEFPVEVSLSPLVLGEATLIISTIRDVTAQRALEKERLHFAEQLRRQAQLIAAAHDAILVCDPESRILSWNRGAEEMYGWTATEVLGQVTHTLFQTYFPFSREAVDAQLAREGQWEGELAHTTKDGRRVLVESRHLLVRDESTGAPTAILEINRDITARRRLEQTQAEVQAATLAQRDLLQELLDAIPSSVCVVHGLDARLVLANRAAEQLWGAVWRPGVPMQTFLARHGIRLVDARGQACAPETWATMRALRQREPVLYHEQVIARPGREHRPVLVNAMPLTSADWPLLGMPAQTVGMGWRPTPEQQATAAEEPLALIVHQDVTLIKEAERLKDEFVALAAHELRNPVAAILGFTQLLQGTLTTRAAEPASAEPASAEGSAEVEDWQREALDQLVQGTQRLAALTDDLLDATRLQAGRLELVRAPSDLVALARRVVRRQQGALISQTLNLETDEAYLVVEMDVGRIEQVLTNLLSNAIKYSPEGGAIAVSVTRDGAAGFARVRVQDQGIGIPAAEQAHLFGRFVRAENARTRQIAGTGLGLFLCRELVERHGGEIGFDSVEGQGSTFCFTLPLTLHDEEPEGQADALA